MTELYVVPGDRHVERLAREGKRAETRASLRARLVATFLPDVAFAEPRIARLTLGMAIGEPAAARGNARQMDLFAAAAAAAGMDDDPLLAAVRGRGGASWARLVTAVDDAITFLRARGATAVHLRRVADRRAGVVAARARTIAVAMDALDDRLARAGLVDGRLVGSRLAEAVTAATAATVSAAVTADRVRARWLLAWDPVDLAWWRALDEKLAPSGGWAHVALPSFDRPLEGARDRDPLEALAEDLARGLDAAPETEAITAVLGDLTGATAVPAGNVRLIRAADAVAQARAVTEALTAALDRGAAVERVAVGAPVLDERTIGPIRRALDDAMVVFHESRGAPPSTSPVVATALHALEAAAMLDRGAVAQLLRSGYVDGPRLGPDLEPREADRGLARIATSLETAPTAAGDDAVERLTRTAAANPADSPLLDVIVGALVRARSAGTRTEHITAARALWTELGIASRAGRGGLRTFTQDAPPEGVARAERLAIARDARAWDALVSAMDAYERTVRASEAGGQTVDREVFRAELVELLDGGSTQPAAGRAAAVRLARLAELAGEELDLLVVVDANEGILPRDDSQDALVSEALAAALVKASRGAFAPPSPAERRSRELASLAVTAADSRAVVLVCPREDGTGAPIEPSVVVDALARGGVVFESVTAEPPPPARRDATLRAAREREREAFFLDPARPRSPTVGHLAEGAAVTAVLTAESGGAERPLSVTSLERFARCPFMGFAYVVLAAREAEARDELPDAREEGSLVHEALAVAFTATRELWPRRPRDEATIVERGLAAAERVLHGSRGHAPLRAVVQLRVRDAVRGLLRAAVEDDAWDFDLAEQAFGPTRRADGEPEPWPPLTIVDDEGRRLSLRGKIDRVDLSHDRSSARVVDYKRSKTTVRDAASSLGDTVLQVPLYASVVSRHLQVPTSGTYLPFQPRDIPLDGKASAKLEQQVTTLVERAQASALAAIETRALAVVAGVRRGALAPTPSDESACRSCAVSGGCRKPRFAMAPVDDTEEA